MMSRSTQSRPTYVTRLTTLCVSIVFRFAFLCVAIYIAACAADVRESTEASAFADAILAEQSTAELKDEFLKVFGESTDARDKAAVETVMERHETAKRLLAKYQAARSNAN